MDCNFTNALVKFSSLWISFSSSFPSAGGSSFAFAKFRIDQRWRHLNLILDRLDQDISLLKNIKKTSDIELSSSAPSLDIETFYIVARSLLDDMAVLTPHFYFSKGRQLPNRSLSDQKKWLIKNPNFDCELSDYMERDMNWFDKCKNTRDDLIHYQAQIIPINSQLSNDGEIEIRFDLVKGLKTSNLGQPKLKTHVTGILKNIIKYIDFYSTHFKSKLSSTGVGYRDNFGLNPKGCSARLGGLKEMVRLNIWFMELLALI